MAGGASVTRSAVTPTPSEEPSADASGAGGARGDVVVIVGMSELGRALASGFAGTGSTVVGWDRGEGVEPSGPCLDLISCDLRDGTAVRSAAETTIERHGQIDVLIVCGEGTSFGAILGLQVADVADIFEDNAFSTLRAVQAVVPSMLARGSGRIILTGSRFSEVCSPHAAGYCMSKAATTALLRTLARELQGSGVLANMMIAEPFAGAKQYKGCFETALMLATLPDCGPSGMAFVGSEIYPIWQTFSSDEFIDLGWLDWDELLEDSE